MVTAQLWSRPAKTAVAAEACCASAARKAVRIMRAAATARHNSPAEPSDVETLIEL